MENQYVIIETVHEKEFRIAMLSYRYVSGIAMYMCLADRYYLGTEQYERERGPIHKNRFTKFADAEKAIQEIMNATSEAL